ncbi:MAG: class I SAM-dependent methyltransferase [Anaerolineae bacterium]|nr:class I SAM-dependent methyltransferase [Anaerolineae bacterium]NUQ04369.1 class I SAM-dependent methyltransferase [Anaerolineae bacterium]
MSTSDRDRWDHIYKGRTGEPDPPPDPLLLHYAPPVFERGEPPTALDLACGVGQNGLWLAEQGYVVDLVDISRTALMRAKDEAARRGLRTVNLLQIDLEEPALERDHYDLVCVFRYLQRDLMSAIRAAVKPGGRIIYQTYNTRRLDAQPDANRAYLLSLGELVGYFGDWRVLRSAEPEALSQLVAVKPERRA